MVNYLLLCVTVVAFTFQSVLCKTFDNKYIGEAADSPMVYSTLSGLFIALATFILSGFRFSPSYFTVVYGISNAVLSYLYNYSLIKAASKGSFSFVMISGLFGGLMMPIVFSMAMYSEIPSVLGFVAIGVMLLSIVIMNSNDLNLKNTSVSYYVWCLLLFISNGAYSVLMKVQSQAMSGNERFEMVIITYLGTALFAIAHLLIMKKGKVLKSYKTGKSALFTVILCALSSTVGMNLNYFLIPRMPIALIVSVLNSGVLILSVLWSVAFFKERPTKAQILGMVLSFSAIIVLSIS